MKILIEAPFDLTDKAKVKIENKLSKLQKYHNNITQAEVYFKTGDGQDFESVIAEVQLHVPGPVIFASESAEGFKSALSGAVKKVKRQLKKAKSQAQDYHS